MPGFAACASGVLQVLIFPKPALYFLSWVALAPLIYAVLQCRNQDALLTMVEDGKWFAPATAWQGFLLGYASGVIWYLGSCYWVYHTMHLYGGLGVTTSIIILILFALYLGLYHGLFGLLVALIARRRNGYSLRALVFAPFAWVAVETRAHLHHRIPLGPAGHHADRQHPALAHRDRNWRLWHLV